ncbi:translation initiation factor IF-2 [archaeon]|jgi:translation initiation factor 5B|nr:translation initiation factor IF-2 [archaeon]MBT4023028.1 translation initiation factor IF-2 [archaeon]MBT4272426.1 translation initiation factor IF-2 [archaeon]MBT4460524.1 translation initiation factor IF-2 [archaeon]MBT4857885.1 translation initiation factor IF-2 [archaeon]
MALRQSIIGVLGHVDHGKTKLLDKIRGSATQSGESGGITQAIGASIIPLQTVKKICGNLLDNKSDFSIPGLLFIDTPGHAAFSTLRKRGGSIADIAILVIDINEGLKPQTIESIEILKGSKTPFVIAANKIDLVPGYKQKDKLLLKNLNNQDPYVQEHIDTKLYEILGKLSELGLNSERFDRVEDYTKQVAIIPVSAITGDGIPELLMVLIGLAQKFLEENLKLHVEGNAKGSVIEVKETTGLGVTLDVIIYDGILKRGDKIMIGGLDKPIETRVKALLCPLPLNEMRDKKTKFKAQSEVTAATGVKISAPGIDNVIAGMPIQSYTDKIKTQVSEEIQKQVKDVVVETGDSGIIIKADTLGSLEALTFLLKEKEIPVRKARIGKISKKDITDAESNYDKNPLHSVILGFNVDRDAEVSGNQKVKIITNDIIYKIIEEYELWSEQQGKILEAKKLDDLIRPCKIQIMKNHVFRQCDPAICGCEIIEGKLTTSTRLMKEHKAISNVKSIQQEKESIKSITKGNQVAVSMDSIIIGRQVHEGDFLYSFIPENDFRKLKNLAKFLSKGEIELLKEIAEKMRKDNPMWGV